MTLEQLTELFKWMTIINVALLILSGVLIMTLKKTVYRVHGKLFGLSEDQVAAVSYNYLGIHRLLVIVFNLVPYVSLVLVQ